MRVLTSGVMPLLLVAAVLCLAGCGTHPNRHDVTLLAQAPLWRTAHWFPPLLVGRDGAQYSGARLQALPAQASLTTTQEQKRENSEATRRGGGLQLSRRRRLMPCLLLCRPQPFMAGWRCAVSGWTAGKAPAAWHLISWRGRLIGPGFPVR